MPKYSVRNLATLLVAPCLVLVACGNGTQTGQPVAEVTVVEVTLLASVTSKAIEDSGFAIPADIYIREALYRDVMAIQYEGDPEFLSEQDRSALRSSLSGLTSITFFSAPSAVVDADWRLLPDRLVVLIGPIETEEEGPMVQVGILAGSDLDDIYLGWYPVNPDTGEVGESPPMTMVP